MDQAWFQSPQAQQMMQSLAKYDQEAVAKLGPEVDTPSGRRNSLLPGQVLRFNYNFHQPGHDPQPLLLVSSDDHANGFLHGINLHYLTMNKARSLLYYNCGNAGFRGKMVSGDKLIIDAYRTYRWSGVQLVKYEDCRFLNSLLKLQGLLTVQQLSAMIERIRLMASQPAAVPAVPTSEQVYTGVGSATPSSDGSAAPAVPTIGQTPIAGQPQ